MKNWLAAVIVVVGLALIVFFSDRPVSTPSGKDLIRSANEYANVNNQAMTLALSVFQKADAGAPLSEEDKKKLREALKNFEAMNTYEPRRVNGYFGAGKCLMILGEKERAAEQFQQAILNKDLDADKDTPATKLTVIEADALESELLLDLAAEEIANYNSFSQSNDKPAADAAKRRSDIYYQKALACADAAVAGKPDGYRYLIDRCNVYLALGKKDLAKKDFLAAKAIAPNDPRVLMAQSLIGP